MRYGIYRRSRVQHLLAPLTEWCAEHFGDDVGAYCEGLAAS